MQADHLYRRHCCAVLWGRIHGREGLDVNHGLRRDREKRGGCLATCCSVLLRRGRTRKDFTGHESNAKRPFPASAIMIWQQVRGDRDMQRDDHTPFAARHSTRSPCGLVSMPCSVASQSTNDLQRPSLFLPPSLGPCCPVTFMPTRFYRASRPST